MTHLTSPHDDRAPRVARTTTDLAGAETITVEHCARRGSIAGSIARGRL